MPFALWRQTLGQVFCHDFQMHAAEDFRWNILPYLSRVRKRGCADLPPKAAGAPDQ
jgi:hypothetical protein